MRVYKPLSEEQKLKISAKMKGRVKSMLHRRNISLGMISVIRTPEHNKNIGKAVSKTRRLQRPRIYLTGPIKFEKIAPKIEHVIRIVRKQPLIRQNYLDRFNVKEEKEVPVIEKNYEEETASMFAKLLG